MRRIVQLLQRVYLDEKSLIGGIKYSRCLNFIQ
nr:MAG TPA: hypothetical protein [Caudoviricetes sp.]